MKPIRLLEKEEIECRIGTISEKGLSLLLFKNARADMKILDETFGALNWKRTHTVIGGNLYCTVSIWDEEKKQWVEKMDVGTESYTEKEKGQASDSFKRACVSVGIGRELYSLPFIWIPASKTTIQRREDNKYITYDKFLVQKICYNEKREVTELLIENQNGKCVYQFHGQQEKSVKETLYDEDHSGQIEILIKRKEAMNRELRRTGVSLQTVLKRYGVKGIEEMSEEVYRKAMEGLKKSRTQTAA